MAPARFAFKEHIIPASFPRDSRDGTAFDADAHLRLHVKQYSPRQPPKPDALKVTIIGAHANGYAKELYEALWDDLYDFLEPQGIYIKNVWIADSVHHGYSYELNEKDIGTFSHWHDYSRDIFQMINHFQSEMTRPIVGVAHSFGGNSILNLALMHPGLFATLVMIEPMVWSGKMLETPGNPFGIAAMSALRRDLWKTKEEAEQSVRKNKMYASWDPRVLDALIEHGFRETPTALYEGESNGKYTLRTPKAQEIFTFGRVGTDAESQISGKTVIDRDNHPEYNPDWQVHVRNFYRPEIPLDLQKLRPSVIFLQAPFFADDFLPLQQKVGTVLGGNGGMATGRVKVTVLPKTQHLIPQMQPKLVAEHASAWLLPELKRWTENEDAYKKRTQNRSKESYLSVPPDYIKVLGPPPGRSKPKAPPSKL